MRLGCPAIVDTGDSIVINEALCVGCDLCMEVCKLALLKRWVTQMSNISIMIAG